MKLCIHLAVTIRVIESEVRQFVFRQALTLMFDSFGYSYPYCYILCYKFISYYKFINLILTKVDKKLPSSFPKHKRVGSLSYNIPSDTKLCFKTSSL